MTPEEIDTKLSSNAAVNNFRFNDIIYMLQAYGDKEESNKEIAKEMEDFMCDELDAFERTNKSRHFTASAWIITDDNERALITHHKKLGLKLQLGGHCDGDFNVLRVALREALEEGGIPNLSFCEEIFDLDIHIIPGNKKEDSHSHYDVRFLFKVPKDSEFIISEESTKLEWITKDYDASECTSGFQRLFQKWKNLDPNDQGFFFEL